VVPGHAALLRPSERKTPGCEGLFPPDEGRESGAHQRLIGGLLRAERGLAGFNAVADPGRPLPAPLCGLRQRPPFWDSPAWARERGYDLELDGLELMPRVADLAQRRLPHLAGRIFTGDVMSWTPPRRFALVTAVEGCVAPARFADLVHRLRARVAGPGGRLVMSSDGARGARPRPVAEHFAALGSRRGGPRARCWAGSSSPRAPGSTPTPVALARTRPTDGKCRALWADRRCPGRCTAGERCTRAPWVRLVLTDAEQPDGRRYEHHVVRVPYGTAGVVVRDPARAFLLLWHRFVTDTWSWEIPTGIIDAGEPPARRAPGRCSRRRGGARVRSGRSVATTPSPASATRSSTCSSPRAPATSGSDRLQRGRACRVALAERGPGAIGRGEMGPLAVT
jgi:hypothetical protein